MKRHLIAAILLLVCTSVWGQIRPSRTWDVEPLYKVTQSGLFPSADGAIEAVRGFSSVNDDQAWQYRLHLSAEVYRFTDSTRDFQLSASMSFHHELTANTFNDISFNPRTARWEERITINAGFGGWAAQVGIVHRCKHDIDNLLGPDEFSPMTPSPIQRTIILTGPQAQLTTPVTSTLLGNASVTGGVDWYSFNVSDHRVLASPLLGSWASMQGSAWIRAMLASDLGSSTYLRCIYWASVPWFSSSYTGPSDTPIPHDARAEVAFGVKGTKAALEIWLAAEHLFDDVSTVGAGPSTYNQLGIRIRPR